MKEEKKVIAVYVCVCMSFYSLLNINRYWCRSTDISGEHVLLGLLLNQNMLTWLYLLCMVIILIGWLFILITHCLCYPGC